MKCLYNNNLKKLQVVFLTVLLLAPSLAYSQPNQGVVRKDSPSGMAIIGDAVVARPILFTATFVGTGLFLGTLPFSALGGNIKESGETLVVVPAKNALLRCLGCTPVQSEKNKTRRKQEISKGRAYK